MSGGSTLEELAERLVLGDVLGALDEECGGFDMIAHWTQGEFHHDLVVRPNTHEFAGDVLIIATNCNGGVKEIVCLDDVPDRSALWHWRCPELPQFEGTLDDIRGVARTIHWFEPARLLADDARSELKPEHRKRQKGGGWIPG